MYFLIIVMAGNYILSDYRRDRTLFFWKTTFNENLVEYLMTKVVEYSIREWFE